MQKKRHPLITIFTVAALAAAGDAGAIGWERSTRSALMGQPLQFTATLRLDPGDSVAPECVSSEVAIGDQPMPAAGVRSSVDVSRPDAVVIHVGTLRSIDEPVVSVTIGIGCPPHMSRRFVLLADPPAIAPPPVVSAAPLVAPNESAPPPAARGNGANSADGNNGNNINSAAASPSPNRSPRPAARETEPARAKSRMPAQRTRQVAAPRRKTETAAAAAEPAPPAGEGRPRLQLEAADPVAGPAAAASAVEDALQAVAQAASAARAAASAASAAEERIASLEREVARLRSDAQQNREQAAEVRSRIAAAEAAGRWLWPMAALAAVFAALAGWLAWRLRTLQEERLHAWRAAAAQAKEHKPESPTTVQIPLVTSEIAVPPPYPQRPAVGGSGLAAPVAAPEHDTQPRVEHTEVIAPPIVAPAADGAPRDVTIEELLDLEQQAEFFIVLGQDDAAIDLLVDHLRDTGGGSPLPYLKLLEIYRRRNDREAYERTRTRFNHRFNAYAPDWDADLSQGASLEDYPGVLERLQQVWPKPLDAMAELEALLFRKSRGQLFDLPAYREVLFLYSLARDLLDREGADSGNVDLLLPLADGSEFGSTSPSPYLGLERDSVFDAQHEDRPTAPVDLDLTQPDEGPSSIVDPLSPRR